MQTDPHERGSSMQQSPTNDTAGPGAVYVQTNAAPNEVIAFRRADDGSLDRIGRVETGGDADGTPHLQSQGSVTLTGDGQYLLVTNAASDDVSVFSVAADGSIELRERVHTGATPRSVDERDGLVVVLNTGEPGLASFRLDAEGIERVEGGDQALDPSDADPAQVAFSPDGSMVLITERATDSIVTYEVTADGTTLIVTEAFGAEKGAAAASSYAIEDGSLVARTSSVGNGRSEICWAVITPDDRFAFMTNFADGAVSRYAIDADGGRIYGWSVEADGALEPIGPWEGVPKTVAGLAAS